MKKNLYQVLQSNSDGYVALVTVLILSLVASLIFVTAMVINTDSSVTSANLTEATVARYYAESCVDIAINNLKSNINYQGNESINANGVTCQIGQISLNAGVYNIPAQANHNDFVYKIELKISQISPNTVIDSYIRIH